MQGKPRCGKKRVAKFWGRTGGGRHVFWKRARADWCVMEKVVGSVSWFGSGKMRRWMWKVGAGNKVIEVRSLCNRMVVPWQSPFFKRRRTSGTTPLHTRTRVSKKKMFRPFGFVNHSIELHVGPICQPPQTPQINSLKIAYPIFPFHSCRSDRCSGYHQISNLSLNRRPANPHKRLEPVGFIALTAPSPSPAHLSAGCMCSIDFPSSQSSRIFPSSHFPAAPQRISSSFGGG